MRHCVEAGRASGAASSSQESGMKSIRAALASLLVALSSGAGAQVVTPEGFEYSTWVG